MNKTIRTEAAQAALLAHLKKNYDYEPKVGGLRNKKTGYYPKGKMQGRRYARYVFRIEGQMVYISIHIAVWAVCKSRWPEGQLDHLNGNKQDNRIENLRECSQRDNNLNTLYPWKPNKVTGVPGVSKDERKKAGYNCKIKGKMMFFRNPYEAFWVAMVCGKKYKQE
jgi:hypothetical protein